MKRRRQLLARLWRGIDDDGALVVQMLVAQAQARLDSQLRDGQGLDIKALGLLGADVAALGVLIADHGLAPGPKLPKPAVPHVYVTLGLGYGWEERMPPER